MTMNSKLSSQAASETLNVTITGGGTMELVAVIAAMVFVACGAALLLTTPSALETVANAASRELVAPLAERPFHERYPVNATAESVDTPTF
jgi:hypothetical protein